MVGVTIILPGTHSCATWNHDEDSFDVGSDSDQQKAHTSMAHRIILRSGFRCAKSVKPVGHLHFSLQVGREVVGQSALFSHLLLHLLIPGDSQMCLHPIPHVNFQLDCRWFIRQQLVGEPFAAA